MASVTQVIRRRHKRQARRRAQQRQRRIWNTLISLALLVLVVIPAGAAVGGAAVVYARAIENLPAPGETDATGGAPTEFYDSSGARLVYTLQNPLSHSDEAWVSIDTLPPNIIAATLAAEDPTFLDRDGFNPLDTAIKLWQNAIIGTLPPDATLTGRLVRNVIAPLADLRGTPNSARAHEIALVAEINRRYTPREILEWHLNTNYYGSEAYGIEAAAQLYLNKRAVDLTLDEAALLAAIPTAPQYNPFSDEIAARGRQANLLRQMLNLQLIGQDSYDEAAARRAPISRNNYLSLDGQAVRPAPEFAVYARRQAENILNTLGYDGSRMLARGSLQITTSLDLDLYNASLCVMQAQFARLGTADAPANCPGAVYLPPLATDAGTAPPNSGSLVILDAATGTIKSMVGAADAAQYQPAPTLQPFVYLSAFIDPGAGYTPATMVFDIPNQFPGSEEGLIYTVSNPDGKFRGPMNLRNAMGAGLLPPAADIANRRGMSAILQTAHQLGLNSLDENSYDLMLLERGGQVSLLDVAYSYSLFATLGTMRGVPVQPAARGFRGRDPVAVLEIRDADGAVLWHYATDEASRCATLDTCTPILQDKLAYLINDILADQQTRWSVLGEGSALDLSRPGAVVNGLSSDRVDNWTVGYTPQYIVGVVLDRADAQPMTLDAFGMNGAAAVWRAVMEYVHDREGIAPTLWQRPDDVIDMVVCDISGLLPNAVCPVHTEIFLDGTQPRQTDTYWRVVEINNQTNQLATVNTPPELRSDVRFFVPPSGSATDWWIANHQPLPPTDYDDVSRPAVFETVQITRPALFDYVGGTVDVYADMNTAQLQYFQLEYGQGLNPRQWFSIGGQQTTFTAGQPVSTWDTAGLDGLYSLRLVVVLNDNTRESSAIQVTVDNVAPQITLDSLEPGKIYRWPGDDVVSLQASVDDNLTVDRVEFYRNNELLGADPAWPFQLDWRIEGLGQHTFTAIAFDAVGNQSSAQVTVEVIRAGS